MSIQSLVALPGLTPGLVVPEPVTAGLSESAGAEVIAIYGVDLIEAAAAGVGGVPGLVAAIGSALDARGLDRATIVAESYSATAALAFAAAHPGRVEELVLAAPIGYAAPLTAGLRQSLPLAEAVRDLHSGERPLVTSALGLLAHRSGEVTGIAEAYAVSTSPRVSAAADVLAGWLASGAFDAAGATTDLVRKVRSQVTLLWGRDDAATGLDSAFYLTRRLRNVRLRVFPGTGHLISVERGVEATRHLCSALGLADGDHSPALSA